MRAIVLWPFAVALACSRSGSPNPSVNTTSLPSTIEVSTVRDAVSVSAVEQPIAVSVVEQPITVSSVTGPVAISSVAQPVAVSGIASPVTVAPITLAGPVTLSGPIVVTRPELDPDRIETGDQNAGNPVACATPLFPCKVLVTGPFILTDAILTRGDAKLFATSDPTDTSALRWTLSLTDHVRAGYDALQTSGTVATPAGTNYVNLTTSVPGSTSAVAGARLAVRAGEKLYVSGSGATFTWSGFRP
jgi:hypothetical protein